MNAKRILKWREHKEDMQWTASASTGSYMIICWIRGTFSAFRTVTASNAHIGVPEHYTLDAAIDACEADYLSRCTEFLTLYNPATHVVVSREAAIALLMNVRGIDDANFAAAELRAALEVGK